MRNFSRTYSFKRGEKIHLDDIYAIQGLCGGDWWRREDINDDLDEDLIITRSIEITISWKSSK